MLAGWVAVAAARTQVDSPALAVRTAGGVGNASGAFLALSITGVGFGMPGPGLRVHIHGVRSAGPVALPISSLYGITWAARRGRVWVSQTNSLAYGPGNTLVGFDPERVLIHDELGQPRPPPRPRRRVLDGRRIWS